MTTKEHPTMEDKTAGHDFAPYAHASIRLGVPEDVVLECEFPPMNLAVLAVNVNWPGTWYAESLVINDEEILNTKDGSHLDLYAYSHLVPVRPRLPSPKHTAPATKAKLKVHYNGFTPPGYYVGAEYVLVVHFLGDRPRPR